MIMYEVIIYGDMFMLVWQLVGYCDSNLLTITIVI